MRRMTQGSDSPPRDVGSDISRRAATALMVAIVGIALALRLYGLDWDAGYDWTPHPDERAILFKVMELSAPSLGELHLLFDAERSPLNPRWFPYGSFPLYLLDALETLSKAVPGIGYDDLRVPARAVSGIADVIAVVFIYLLGRAIWSRRVGVLAAFLVAVAVLHIQLSHFFAVDTLLALLSVGAIYFMVRVARRGRPADSALAGLFIGLALATKISIAPILAPYAVAHLMYAGGLAADDRETILNRLRGAIESALIGGAVMAGALLIAQPYAFLDWTKFYADISEQSEMVSRIRDYPYTRQYIDTTPYLYHAQQLATWGLGIPMGVAALCGLLYASVRGLRIWYAAAYLLAGVVLPAVILTLWSSLPATLLASAIAVAAVAATIPLRDRDTRIDALLLSLVVPYFLIVGAFEVKFTRYLIPITPILLLFASRMLIDVWMWARRSHVVVRAAVFAIVVFAVAATAFYGFAYMGIYAEPHTATRASEWIRDNARPNSLILKEHWEEGLPRLHDYRIEELQIYEPDTPAKLRRMSDRLARADYITLYSNRLYGTVSRLPERYPVSRAYYKALFAGELGYDLAASFTSYPNLLGVGFVDDTFGRPDLEPPPPLADSRPHPVSLDLGYADESFSVYDHPKTLIFRNTGGLDSETIQQRILDGSGGYPSGELRIAAHSPAPEPGRRLMLTPEQSAERQAGGAWTEIVRTGGLAERAPALVWIVAVEALALVSVPLCFIAFRPFVDRGWLMSKAVGLLLVGLGIWLLASLEAMPFTRATAVAVALAFAAINAVLLIVNRAAFADFLKRRWKTVAVAELLFLAAFLAFVAIRMANPDLWHPYRGGEKPMDMAYLNAVLRSAHMPPYDPWFSGGYLNYYYWGQFLVSTLIHLTGIAPEVAVNLAIPTFFAMTVALSYGVVYNLAAAANVRALSPALAGLAGAAFVTVIGNLDGAIQLAQSAWRVAVKGVPAAPFDFWRSSRMMPPDPPGFEITEFPFFTFLFADPHAHLWALPFTVLCIGLSVSALLGLSRTARRSPWNSERLSSLWGVWGAGHLLTLAILGVAVGALRALNTWDYPTYLLFAFACIGIGEYLSQGGLSGGVIFRAVSKSALVLVVGYVAFLPYHNASEVFFIGVESTTNRTTLWQMLGIFGLFVFIIGSYCLWTLRHPISGIRAAYRQASGSITDVLSGVAAPRRAPGLRRPAGPSLVVMIVAASFLAGVMLTALFSGSDWGAATLAGILLGLIAIVGVRSLASPDAQTPVTALVALASATAFSIVIGIDFVRVEGDIDRLNSVFKFYLQAWALLAIASAYIVWRMASAIIRDRAMLGKTRWVWTGCLVVLLLCAFVFTALGSRARIGDRFDDRDIPLTLDGLAYAEGATYRDEKGAIDLAADLEGIRWLRENARGSPVILEGITPLYRWGSRVSVHTGLPSVVGWDWHQQQQRWGYRNMVNDRVRDVNRIYNTMDTGEALELLRRYDVTYIYVGQVERLYYESDGLDKFATAFAPHLRPVFTTDAVTIYEFME